MRLKGGYYSYIIHTFENLWYIVHVLFKPETFEMPKCMTMALINVECQTQTQSEYTV
jgi:hypothetical protein